MLPRDVSVPIRGAVAMTKVSTTLAGFLLIASCATAFAAGVPAKSEPVEPTGKAKPMAAWTEFCARVPAECAVDVSEPAFATLDTTTWVKIRSVNRRVNETLKPVTDDEHWGVADRWDVPTDGAGDCEDFQILKRKLLVEAGLPRRAMRMTVVIDGRGDGHAVLMVRTDRGDLVLDNKTNAVRHWHETGYVYVKRESSDAVAWVSLGRAVGPSEKVAEAR